MVLQSIWNTTALHFKTGFTVTSRASASREVDPDFSGEEFDDKTNTAIVELHLAAADITKLMGNIHYNTALLKTRVSPQNFLKIISSVGLPLTTIQLVDPVKQNTDMDNLRIQYHIPDPALLLGATKPTRLLAAMVRYQMQNCLLTVTGSYSLTKCENEFGIGRSEFERVVTGKKRHGGHEYERQRLISTSELPSGSFKTKTKKANPVDRSTRGSSQVGPTVCKYCGKVCATPDSLSVHINNEHPKDQSYFMCTFCAEKFNDYTLYLFHLNKHSKDMYRCYICKEQFKDPHSLRVHAREHFNQCPLCSRSFKSKQGLTEHIKKKRCDYCNAVFDELNNLTEHCGTEHRYFQCDICFAGFVSEPVLVKHKEADHPEGRPGNPGNRTPSALGLPEPEEEEDPDIAFISE